MQWTEAEHQLVEYEVACAYEDGVRAGRQLFAAELLPALRWLLAGGADDALSADFDTLMARHLRAIQQRRERAAWDRANRLAP